MLYLRPLLFVSILVILPRTPFAQRIDWERLSDQKPWEEFEVIDDTTFLALYSSYDTPFQPNLLRTTDAGKSWTSEAAWGIVTEDDHGIFHGNYITSIRFESERSGWAFGGHEGRPAFFFSSDAGRTWAQQNFTVQNAKVGRFEALCDDIFHVYFSTRYSTAPDTRGVYSVNKLTNRVDTIITWADIAKNAVPFVDGASLSNGFTYVVARSEPLIPYLLFKRPLDSIWIKVPVDTVASKRVRIVDSKHGLLVSNENRLFIFDTSEQKLIPVFEFTASVRFFIPKTNFVIAVIGGFPGIMYCDSTATKWMGLGSPAVATQYVKLKDDSTFYTASSSQINRGHFDIDGLAKTREGDKIMQDVQVFPNPASSYIQLYSSKAIGYVEIIDALGSKVLESNSPFVDIEQLPAGPYMVRAHTDEAVQQVKMVVRH